jgi:hypothetical protein
MRALNQGFFALFFALSLLPLAAKYGGFLPEVRLFGAVKAPEPVLLDAHSYYDGSFQQAFEQLFNAEFSLRGAAVRTDNELNFRVFREFSPALGTVLGSDDFLYPQGTIDDYNRRKVVSISVLEQTVQRLKLLQDFLEARHSVLLLVVSPSKTMLYPELLPLRFVDEQRLRLPNNYSLFVSLLEKHGVSFIDSERELSERKAESPFRFFASSGMHWNNPAACMITSEMAHFIAQRLHEGPELRCDPPVLQPAPSGTDRDLADLANLWDEEALFHPTPYSAGHARTHRGDHQLSVLFVGSSFVWNILSFAKRLRLYRHYSFFYYYNTRHDYPGGRSPIDRERLDWANDIFTRQAIVLEVNASVVDEVGWGFLEDAERAIARLAH